MTCISNFLSTLAAAIIFLLLISKQLHLLPTQQRDLHLSVLISVVVNINYIVYSSTKTPIHPSISRLIPNDGINTNDPVITKRVQTCALIFSALDESGLVLIRSPPFSGKTSLGTLLHDYACKEHKECSFVSAAGLFAPTEIIQAIENTISQSWIKLTISSTNYYLIIDEAQTLYQLSDQHEFWF